MRKKHTFLLTIFPTEEQQPALHGRLQFISTGNTFTFTNMEELQHLIVNHIMAGESPNGSHEVKENRSSYPAVDLQHWDEEI